MRRGATIFAAGSLLLLAACTRTIVVTHGPTPDRRERGSRPPPRTPPEPPSPPDRPADRPNPPPSNPPDVRPPAPPSPPPPPRVVVRLMIPPGHLPDPGECRVWIPAMPPGLQPGPRSRPCAGLEAIARPGSWIVYRPRDDRKLVYVRLLDEHRRGIVIRIRIFDIDTQELVREEEPGQNERPPEQRPPEQRPPLPPREVIPPVQPPPDTTPPRRPPAPPPDTAQPPQQRPPAPPDTTPPPRPPLPPPEHKPPEPPSGPSSTLTLNIPPGHLPEIGECRLWLPGFPPGRQPRPKSRPCDGITGVAPAGSWIVYRPSDDRRVVHVRILDERRAGVVIRIRIFDIDSKQLLREESP